MSATSISINPQAVTATMTNRPRRKTRADRESRVRELAAASGINFTISDVARGTGLHLTHVSRIFNGKRKPSLAAAKKIADYLHVSLDRLNTVLQ